MFDDVYLSDQFMRYPGRRCSPRPHLPCGSETLLPYRADTNPCPRILGNNASTSFILRDLHLHHARVTSTSLRPVNWPNHRRLDQPYRLLVPLASDTSIGLRRPDPYQHGSLQT